MLEVREGKADNLYSGYAWFSNWKGIKCDYATNAIVASYYSGNKVGWFRTNRLKEFNSDPRDTLLIGLDYYALTGVCSGLIPSDIVSKYGEELKNGKVKVIQLIRRKEN